MTVDPLIATMLERDDALRYRAKTADMLTRDERLALTQYLIENPVVVNPKRLA